MTALSTNRRGISLLEMLIVLSVAAVLLAIGAVQVRPPAARAFANDVKAQIEQARYEAVKRSVPVAVRFRDGTFVTTVDPLDPADGPVTVAASCDDDAAVLLLRNPGEYRGVSVMTSPPEWSVVWLPSGQGRTCGGSLAIGSAVEITDGRTTRFVEVSVGGRVSVQ